jgi:hypothetical protein
MARRQADVSTRPLEESVQSVQSVAGRGSLAGNGGQDRNAQNRTEVDGGRGRSSQLQSGETNGLCRPWPFRVHAPPLGSCLARSRQHHHHLHSFYAGPLSIISSSSSISIFALPTARFSPPSASRFFAARLEVPRRSTLTLLRPLTLVKPTRQQPLQPLALHTSSLAFLIRSISSILASLATVCG